MVGSRSCVIPILLTVFCCAAVSLIAAEEPAAERSLPEAAKQKIDFVRDIQPILTARCVDCHGPDAAEGRLRLDARQIVFQGGISGPSIKKGSGADSLLIHRLLGRDGADAMPLDDEPLSDAEIGLIRAWIDQGAKWPDGVGADVDAIEKHWAYVKPERPSVPQVENESWVKNPIDAFILARLEQQGLSPSREADKQRLIRRATLDLTGLPPTIAEIDAFLADDRPNAYEFMIDRLLSSPRYGERWSIPWLDAARYADSNGYQRDGRRVYWAYRDWVINALNADMPFDQFTVEQIAGDLLPNPTVDQQIATGFHRGTMANVEAGTDPEEERVLANIDRVNTTGTVWLGTTIECAQCHNHKYDPFTQEDFYRLYAFFNSTELEIESSGSGRQFTGPKMPLPLPSDIKQQRQQLQAEIARAEKAVEQVTGELKQQQPDWEQKLAAAMLKSEWKVLQPTSYEALEGSNLKLREDNSLLAGGNFPGTDIYEVVAETDLRRITALRLEILTDPTLPEGGPGRVAPGNFILSEFKVHARESGGKGRGRKIMLTDAVADYSQKNWNVTKAIDGNRKTGWAVAKQFGQGHYAVFIPQQPIEFASGGSLTFTLDQQYGNSRTIGCFQLLATDGDPQEMLLPETIQKIVALPEKQRTKKQSQELATFYVAGSSELKSHKERLTKLKQSFQSLAPPTTLVMKELSEPRMTRMFHRGDFLNPGKKVQAGTPRILHDMPQAPNANRLTLARWLISEDNPLVARVTVNRHWSALFGQGIVQTIEDFGTQGEPPTHPALLDWLATEFVRQGWSQKELHRLIVTSATYRQSSRVSTDLLNVDPYNKLYARGPRYRLTAELVRDNALAAAGLLSDKMHGPPVFPVQPDGVWNHIGVASNDWTTSSGEDLLRRGLYVYWRRTVPYPSFVNFDAVSREACSVQRSRSNTPLQALTLMNDPAFFEAATALASRMLTEVSESAQPADRVAYGFRLATARHPSSTEVDILVNRFHEEHQRYSTDPQAAKELIEKWRRPDSIDEDVFAAWIHVANILLNLDEVVTKG